MEIKTAKALGLTIPQSLLNRAGRAHSMTDLERLGLALVGFPLAVVVGGALLGVIGAWIRRAKEGEL